LKNKTETKESFVLLKSLRNVDEISSPLTFKDFPNIQGLFYQTFESNFVHIPNKGLTLLPFKKK